MSEMTCMLSPGDDETTCQAIERAYQAHKPTTGQGLILILLLSVSLTTMIGGIIILARTSRR